ncbi:MAG: hypothetical protein J1G05_05755 [Clostridiales bacterium]|nr:hypothetical protein [Clostridiales bacterium]
MVIAANYMREISNVFEKSDCINVYTAGDVKTYKSGTDEFKGIISCWYEMIEGAYDMPAFGVSLHAETLEAMKSGKWIEFVFNEKKVYNGMTFEKLLIQIESGFKGFNLIRYNSENGYSGRCFYFNLVDNDMSKLSDYLADFGQK